LSDRNKYHATPAPCHPPQKLAERHGLLMKYLFVHQNFPGQFRHLAPALAARGHEVWALGINAPETTLPGVRHLLVKGPSTGEKVQRTAPELRELHAKFVRGQATAEALRGLTKQGFVPDVIYSHPGWGESMFLRDVCPSARQIVFAEYYYGSAGGDTAFDPEFSTPSDAALMRSRVKNTHLLHALSMADAAVSPTEFQRSQHPAWAQARMEVIHDGIDTPRFAPDPKAVVKLRKAGLTLRPGDEVVTFVARQLEPYRGYHIFMRSLAKLQKLRPQAQVVIVGGDGVSYGAAPPAGKTWRQIFVEEVASGIDARRVHFVGRVKHELLTQLMQVSAAHVYLTYPFVLSWSLLEAMSIGCMVIGSDTAPVREVITHGQTGWLTDFFDADALAHTVAQALAQRAQPELSAMRQAARRHAIERFDLHSVCLPRQLALLGG
jgi:glycosyltransferase involved in cell wall biosynthesis